MNCLKATVISVLIAQCGLLGDVKLPSLFTDNMVLQKDAVIPVWGWADEGEKISVFYEGRQIKETVAKEGKWRVYLDPMASYQKSGTLYVYGKNKITLKNVAVGEVWICSGQSNMQWSVDRTHEPQTAIATSTNPNIRLFYVPRVKSDTPMEDVDAKWELCNPDTVPGFSAVAYYFGRALEYHMDAPIGLIHTSWGGSPAEVWMSHEKLAGDPDYKRDILESYEAAIKKWEEATATWEEKKEAEGEEAAGNAPRKPNWKPSELYNGMIAPLLPYAIKGAIWYQGESNAGRAWQYRTLFPDMIRNWREDWSLGDFPFLAVQLAPWDKNRKRDVKEIIAEPVDSDWAELREAQLLATQVLPNSGMAVITDLGQKDDIHPVLKEPVGERLATVARGMVYDADIVWSGPVYKGMTVRGDTAYLDFKHVGTGLVSKGGKLTGFSICGPDRKFVWANARISNDGKQVVVSHANIKHPVAVRYGWADYPVVNLWNKEDLPASPFRTDGFPLTTKK